LEIELHTQAKEELENFSPSVKEKIKAELRELEEKPTGHENSGTVEIKQRTVFRYVIKEGNRGGKIDHRAVYDIQNGKVIVYTVFHRDKGYQKNKIAKRF
jgi:mRNA-degrading endonuclease RelE of RelBE toxin-antitoxin system